MNSIQSPFTAMLFDRDGTLIEDRHYLSDPEGVVLLPGVGKALGAFAAKGVRLFVVSNQSGIGRGMFSEEAANACNLRMEELLRPYGVAFDDILFCPHSPDEHCGCRKPATGMWQALCERHGLAPEDCLMVGDKEEDMRFAANAGLAARILVLTGKGTASAEKLGLRLSGASKAPLVTPCPASPAHPHVCISGFSELQQGLSLLLQHRETACGV